MWVHKIQRIHAHWIKWNHINIQKLRCIPPQLLLKSYVFYLSQCQISCILVISSGSWKRSTQLKKWVRESMHERDFWCFVFCFVILGVCVLTEWCLGWRFYTCPCAARTFFSFTLRGLGGWSVLTALIAFLGFGLWEALEEYQKRRERLCPSVPLLPARSPLLPGWVRLCPWVSTFYKEGWQWFTVVAGPGTLASFASSLTPIPPGPSPHAHQSDLTSVLFLVWSLANTCKHYILGHLVSHLTYQGHLSKSVFKCLIHSLQYLYFVNICLLCGILVIPSNISKLSGFGNVSFK